VVCVEVCGVMCWVGMLRCVSLVDECDGLCCVVFQHGVVVLSSPCGVYCTHVRGVSFDVLCVCVFII